MRAALVVIAIVASLTAPTAASLTVRFVAGRSSFAIGERIQLDLEFNGAPDGDLYFSTETYDRSGRMGTETFTVSPRDGTTDPLSDYFTSGMGFIGGGLRSWHTLDGTPFHLHVDLNEWIRFTRPGTYTLTVRSRRLHRYPRGPAPEIDSGPIPLDITTPSPSWALAELARAREDIASGSPERMQQGVAVLRYLDTRDAALELLASYDRTAESLHFQSFAGLVQSPFRPEIVSAMEARIDGGLPLPRSYLVDAALLAALLDVPADAGDAATRTAARERMQAGYGARWAAAAFRGPATVERFRGALALVASEANGETSLALVSALAAHPAIAADAFATLDRPSLRTLLEYRWAAIGDAPWARGALEKVYAQSKGDCRFPDVADFALQHLMELDPAAGRSLALDEIATGAHGVTYAPLSSVEGVIPPALDAALLRRLDRARSDDAVVTLWLMARYGSRELTPVVRRVVGNGAGCATEAAAIVYLLQHHPEEAVARLQPGFDRSRGCVVVPWREIAPRYWDGRLEAAALAYLTDADVASATEAIQVLGEKGSAAVKAPLMDRFAEWHQEWRDRAAELDRLRGRPVDSPERLANALMNALLGNRRLALTPADLSQIRAWCVSDSCRTTLDVRVRSGR